MKNNIQRFLFIWLVILLFNQFFIFGACFAPYCLIAALPHTGVIAFLSFIFSKKVNFQSYEEDLTNDQKLKTKFTQSPLTDPVARPTDRFKEKGDAYEMFIGKKFEDKGEFVIYNGFIKGYEDQGVDIVSICPRLNTINLIQCKNWTLMRMTLEHIQGIYSKLNNYNYACLDFSIDEVNFYRAATPNENNTADILARTKKNLSEYTIRKTLYIASENVVDLEVGPFLIMMSPNIFKYKDMKIVMKKLSK